MWKLRVCLLLAGVRLLGQRLLLRWHRRASEGLGTDIRAASLYRCLRRIQGARTGLRRGAPIHSRGPVLRRCRLACEILLVLGVRHLHLRKLRLGLWLLRVPWLCLLGLGRGHGLGPVPLRGRLREELRRGHRHLWHRLESWRLSGLLLLLGLPRRGRLGVWLLLHGHGLAQVCLHGLLGRGGGWCMVTISHSLELLHLDIWVDGLPLIPILLHVLRLLAAVDRRWR